MLKVRARNALPVIRYAYADAAPAPLTAHKTLPLAGLYFMALSIRITSSCNSTSASERTNSLVGSIFSVTWCFWRLPLIADEHFLRQASAPRAVVLMFAPWHLIG